MQKKLHHLIRLENRRGFSLVEVILAVVIASIAISGTINAFNAFLIAGVRAVDRNTIEQIINEDLGWIKGYAAAWKMKSGPYNYSTAITKTSSFTTSPYVSYAPPETGTNSCTSGLGAEFLADAAAVTMTPARPQPIPTSANTAQTLTLPSGSSGYSIKRTISYGSGAQANRIDIHYAITGDKATSLGISRETAIYLEAAAWCHSG